MGAALTAQNGDEIPCQSPFTLLRPHNCDITVTSKERARNEIEAVLNKEHENMQVGKLGRTHSLPEEDQGRFASG